MQIGSESILKIPSVADWLLDIYLCREFPHGAGSLHNITAMNVSMRDCRAAYLVTWTSCMSALEFYYRSERVLEGATLRMKVSNSGHLITPSGPFICRCRNCWCCLWSNHVSQSSLTCSYTPFAIITTIMIFIDHRNNPQYIYRCWWYLALSHHPWHPHLDRNVLALNRFCLIGNGE